jgi:hypothetical protein
MTSSLGRVYAIVLAMLVFFLAWAAIAARPWVDASGTKTDPRIIALNARERRLRADAVKVRAVVNKRWALYRAALAKRKRQITARKKALAAQQARIAASRAAPSSSAPSSAPAPVIKVAPASPPATQTRTS